MRTPMDAAISKTKGVVGGVRAGRTGLVGVFRTLSEQHGEAGALCDRIKKHPEKRHHLWQQLRVSLLSHEKAELLEVFPVIRRHGGEAIADHHEAEATQLEQMIIQLDAMDYHESEWMPMFAQITSSVLQHAHEEERDLFPEAQRLIGEPLAKELDRIYQKTQKAVVGTVA